MSGEFYIEGKQEKVDLTEIRNILSEMRAVIAGMVDFWSEPVEEVQVNATAFGDVPVRTLYLMFMKISNVF